MVTLFCAIVGVAGDAFAVNIDAVETVGDLKEVIKKVRGLKDFDAKNLQLFLAKKDGAWLPDDKALDVLLQSELDAAMYTKLCASWRLDSPTLFGPKVSLGEEVVHVLVVPSEAAPQTRVLGRRSAQMRDDQQQLHPFPKKPNTKKYVQFAGPVDEQDFCIPLDTISAFQQIREGFSYGNRPLYLLQGPRQFGKTTIANCIEKWLTTSRSDVMCLFFEANELVAADETEFWNRLGKLVSKGSKCRNYSSFMDLVDNCASSESKKVCLILDKMDSLFSNPDLVTTFLQVLRMWKAQSGGFFLGFLGVGSCELENVYKIFRGGITSVPFNVSQSIKVEPFTTSQMTDFFSLIEHRWTFPASLQEGIMRLSGGAPGVFGSLIRFTIDEAKWALELEQWEVWFFELRYYTYLHAYNHTYARIQQDLHQLNDEEWWLLKRLLGNDEDVTVMDKAAARLLRMGVVTERPVETGQYGWKTILAIVSPMMKRVCLDALPTREIHQTVTAEDPV